MLIGVYCVDLHQPWFVLDAHLSALRAIPRFAKCTFRLIVECNLSGQGGAICEAAIQKVPEAAIVCSTNHSYGVYTVPGSKAVYFTRVRGMMAREALMFYETIVSACPYQTAAMTRQQLSVANREKFEQQMRSFRYVYPVPSLTSMPKGIFTGKADHENKFSTRMQDDMVMALGFGINYALDLCADPPFARLRTKMNPLY